MTTGQQLSSLGRHSLPVALTLGLFGGLAYWGSTVRMAGAVMAPGSIVVQFYPKRAQHPEGGVVKAVYVQNGDVVAAGQPLVLLDETAIAASLAALTATLGELLTTRRSIADLAEQIRATTDRLRRLRLGLHKPALFTSRLFTPSAV